MRNYRQSVRLLLSLVLLVALLVAVGVACSEQEAPFAVGDRATPTSTPTDVVRSEAAAAATPTSTPAPIPTSVPIALPTSTPLPTAAPTATAIPATAVPATQATPVSSGESPTPTPEAEPTATAPPTPEPTTAPTPTTAPAPQSQVDPTHTPVPLPADYSRSTSGVPIHEFIKFAHWDENRVRLGNFVAGFIISQGLNYPFRTVDLGPEDYKNALQHNDVDVVLEADPKWAKPYADAGIIVLLKPLSSASPDTVVAVNATLWQRAPEVGQFLEGYVWDGDLLAAESKKIKSGRIAITEKVVGLTLFKKNEEVWAPWISAPEIENIKAALEDRKTGYCREWEVRRLGPFTMQVCKDDPSINIRL